MLLAMFHPVKTLRSAREAAARAEQAWLDVDIGDVSTELVELAGKAVDRELTSREALSGRLTTTITFAGALLALALTLGQRAGSVFKDDDALRTVFAIGFTTAVALLALAIVTAIWALRPEPRHRTNPELLRHYATSGAEAGEIRRDSYRFEVALVAQLGKGNTRRAKWLLRAQRILATALVVAAAEAVILFFGTG